MKRKFYEFLLNFKNSKDTMPLMVLGARQVGKTYLIEEFCKKNYSNYLYVNFDSQPNLNKAFIPDLVPENIIRRLSALMDKDIVLDDSIIFFDEIQSSENAIASLKYFCESENDYKIVCAGSLLGVVLNRFEKSFPVGKVRIETMYPMDFEEYLWAIGKTELAEQIKLHYGTMTEFEEVFHEQAIREYKHYLCIGGMPACVKNYIDNDRNLGKFDLLIPENITTSYIADMSKYTTASDAIKVKDMYLSMPVQLARKGKKFNFALVKDGAKKERYGSAVNWLTDSGILQKANLLNSCELPLRGHYEKNIYKLYVNDVGLLASLANIKFNSILYDEMSSFKGMITENYAANALTKNKHDLFYWESDYSAEVDFVITDDTFIVPVEVKSSVHTKSKSLNVYMDKFNPKYAIRLSLKNFGYNNGIKSIPLYAAHLI